MEEGLPKDDPQGPEQVPDGDQVAANVSQLQEQILRSKVNEASRRAALTRRIQQRDRDHEVKVGGPSRDRTGLLVEAAKRRLIAERGLRRHQQQQRVPLANVLVVRPGGSAAETGVDDSSNSRRGRPVSGLELALSTHSKAIKVRADVVVVWLHWCLLRNGFANRGSELPSLKDYHASEEVLPLNFGWNGDKLAYVLRYVRQAHPYVLSVASAPEDDAFVKVYFVSLHKSACVDVSVSDMVSEDFRLDGHHIEVMTKKLDETLIAPMLPPPEET